MPKGGFSDQTTPVFVVPVTEAVSACDCKAINVAVEGVTEMVTGGTRVKVEYAVLVGSAALVAVTMMVCGLVMIAGAV